MKAEESLLPHFVPLKNHVRWTHGLLLATMVLCWIAVGIELAHLRMLILAAAGAGVPLELREAQFFTNDWLFGIQVVVFGATAVAFLIWLWQARVNVRALGVRRLRYTRGWTIYGFLVPVLNFFRPYQVLREIWQGSDPSNLNAFNWRSLSVPLWLPVWWGLFVGWVVLEILTFGLGAGAGSNLPKLQLATFSATIADIVAALAAWAGTFMVARLSEAQERKLVRQRSEPAAA